jgi:hypothetical protein
MITRAAAGRPRLDSASRRSWKAVDSCSSGTISNPSGRSRGRSTARSERSRGTAVELDEGEEPDGPVVGVAGDRDRAGGDQRLERVQRNVVVDVAVASMPISPPDGVCTPSVGAERRLTAGRNAERR